MDGTLAVDTEERRLPELIAQRTGRDAAHVDGHIDDGIADGGRDSGSHIEEQRGHTGDDMRLGGAGIVVVAAGARDE